MSRSSQENLKTIEDFVESLTSTKTAGANMEPTTQGGTTSHPIKNEDDGTQDATTGASVAETKKEVISDLGNLSVDGRPAEQAGNASDNSTNIGMKAVGPDEIKVEATEKKEDPGSSHPARADNESIDKSSADLNSMPFSELLKLASDIGNDLVTHASGGWTPNHARFSQQSTGTQKQASYVPQDIDGRREMERGLVDFVGVDMAKILSGTMDKRSADEMASRAAYDLIKEAEDDADRVGQCLAGYFQEKEAMGEEGLPPGDVPGAEDAMSAMGGGDDSEGEDMLSSLSGPGDPMQPGAGELEELLSSLGITEEDLLAAISGEEGPGKIQQMLAELGMSEEELLQIIAGDEAGGTGGGPAGAPGGVPAEPALPSAPPGMEDTAKLARDYIKEVASRSRQRQYA